MRIILGDLIARLVVKKIDYCEALKTDEWLMGKY